MIGIRVRIPKAVASSLRADAPQQLVGMAVRTDEWPALRALADANDITLSPYMMFRRVEWRCPLGSPETEAEVRAFLEGVDAHRYYPLAREILTSSSETVRLAAPAHAGTLLDPDRIRGPMRLIKT